MRTWILAAPLLLLAACGGIGGGEDFAVEMKGKPARAYSVLASARIGAIGQFFPGIRFNQTRPSDTEVLFTIPMKGPGDTKLKDGTILFRLESGKDGSTTLVHTTVNVPPVPMLMGKANMVLSESKVERELRKILERMAKNLAAGSSADNLAEPLGDLLAAVAIAGNSDFQAMANQARRNPAALTDLFGESEAGSDLAADEPARDITADPGTAETAVEQGPAEPADPVDEEPPAE